MNVSVRRHDRAGEHQEIGRHRLEVAHRAVGDDAGAAEPLVHMGLYFAPERAEPGVGRIDILDDGHARQRVVGNMLVIAEPHLRRLLAAARMGFAGADDRGPRKGDDRLHLRKSGEQRSAVEPHCAARRHDELERIADRRCIEFPKCFEIGTVWQAGHGRLLHASSSEVSLYWERPPAARPLLLGADHAATDHEPEWDHQGQNDERDGETAFGPAPSFPVGNPIFHKTPAPRPLHPSAEFPCNRSA